MDLIFSFAFGGFKSRLPWSSEPMDHRWVLIAFKREFSFDDVLRLWEVMTNNGVLLLYKLTFRIGFMDGLLQHPICVTCDSSGAGVT